MNHENFKKLLLEDDKIREEYDALEPIYEIKRELIKLRIEKGLSQKQLADIIGTKQSAISRLESADTNPSIEFLNKIAIALGKKLHITFN